MAITIFPIFLFIFQFACYLIGVLVVKKASQLSNNAATYFLSGRSLGKWSFMFTLLATQIGGGLLIGSAEQAYYSGWIVIFFPLGAAFGLAILGLGLGKKFAKFHVLTVGAILKEAYRSSLLQKIGGLLSISSLFFLLVAQMITSMKLLNNFGLHNIGWFIGFWLMIIFYAARGGFKSVVATDIVQSIFFSLGLFFAFFLVYFSKDVNFTQVFSSCTTTTLSFRDMIGWFILPLFFVLVEQDLIQRFFAVADKKIICSATLIASSISLCVTLIPVIFGLVAAHQGIESVEGSSILLVFIHSFFHSTITALLGCAILAAVVSSADSFINSLAANIVGDLFNEDSLPAKTTNFYVLVSLLVGLVSIFVSLFLSNIFNLLMKGYAITVVCLACPILMAVLKKGPHNKESAFCAIFFGTLGFVIFSCISVNIPSEFLGIIFSVFGFIAGEKIAKKRLSINLTTR